MKDLLGVVLCGGRSTRMGSDKGLLKIQDKPWAKIIAEKLGALDLPVVLSINQDQISEYKKVFPETSLIIDKMPVQGPLNGLLSIHDSYPQKDLLLMACDLIDMDQETLSRLVRKYTEQTNFDFYIFRLAGFTQPFCAIYTAKALAGITERLKENRISKYSLHDRFEEGNTIYIPTNNNQAFNNYNSL